MGVSKIKGRFPEFRSKMLKDIRESDRPSSTHPCPVTYHLGECPCKYLGLSSHASSIGIKTSATFPIYE